MKSAGWSVALASLLLGCGREPASSQMTGELGNGRFTYVCVEDSDPVCPSGGMAQSFPERVGTGGTFDVEFAPFDEDDVGHFEMEPAAPGIIQAESELLHAAAPGVVALLAKRTSDSRVLDFVHLHVVDVAGIRLESEGSTPRLVWTTGSRETLRASALDSSRSVLAGSRKFTWTTSAAAVVRLERASPAATMELFPLSPGSATITVSTGEVSLELELTVEGKPAPPPDDAGSPDADAAAPEGGADGAAGSGDAGSDAPMDSSAADAVAPDAASAADAATAPDAGIADGGPG